MAQNPVVQVTNDFYQGFRPIEGLMESYRPRDVDHFNRVVDQLKGGHLAVALYEYEQERKANIGLREAMISDDLPILMAGSVDTRFRQAYSDIQQNWRQAFPSVSFANFREQTVGQLTGLIIDDYSNAIGPVSGAGNSTPTGLIPAVPESMSYNEARIGEEYEVASLATYGCTFSITRQMLINDDRRIMDAIPAALGVAMARTLNTKVAKLLEAGTTETAKDGVAWFNTTHGNTSTAGLALTVANIEAQIQAFMLQENSDGHILGLTPRFLVTHPAQEITLRTILGDAASTLMITGMTSTSAVSYRTAQNIINSMITPVFLPELTDTNDWFLMANPAEYPTVAVGFLGGRESPELFVQDAPDLTYADGIKHKIRHDFVAYYEGWAGIRRVTGA